MRKFISIFASLLLCSAALLAQETHDSLATQKVIAKKPRRTLAVGRQLQKDTTKVSGRSLKAHVIIPKGDWQVGMTVTYLNFSTDDSEFMLLLNDAKASASVFRIAPEASYSYHNNQAVGLRLKYTNAYARLDAADLDLLGNFSLDLKDVGARSSSYGGYVYNRSYIGLDHRGRVGLFLDEAFGFTRSKSVVSSDAYTINKKLSLTLSPGLVYFPMNNLSLSLGISIVDISYNKSNGYVNGAPSGERNFFRAQAKLNLMNLYFGLAIHL